MPKSPAPRRVLLVVGCATLLLLAVAGPASADIPLGWSDPPPVPVLRDLLVFIGIPVLITLGILAAIYLPGVVRGESVAPAGARNDDQWFGGRRETAELNAGSRGRHAQETDADADAGADRPGGAGGSW